MPRLIGLFSRSPQITPPGLMPGWCGQRPGAATSVTMKQNRNLWGNANGPQKGAIRSGADRQVEDHRTDSQ